MNDVKPLPYRRSVIGTSFQGRPLVIYPIFINPTWRWLELGGEKSRQEQTKRARNEKA
jgi:hypothetical protein